MDRQIVEYRIEVEETLGRLQRYVSTAIEQGWQPLGAPFFTPRAMVAQAMVKYAPHQIINHLNIGIGAAERAAAFIEDAQRHGWPAPGVYGDRAHIEHEPTMRYCASRDCPGEHPCGLARCMMPAPDRPYSTPDENNAEQAWNKE